MAKIRGAERIPGGANPTGRDRTTDARRLGRSALLAGWTALLALPGVSVEPRRAQAVECANAGVQVTPPDDGGVVNNTACGNAAVATGGFSAALGDGATASGLASTALGASTSATGIAATAVGRGANAPAASSTALGSGAIAMGTSSTAVGAAALALGTFSTAVGHLAVAEDPDSTAVGALATASFAGSTAIGNGATTTRANQQSFGTATNTYTMAGITSAASAAAQTGPRQIVTSDAGGNLATASLASLGLASSADVSSLQSQIDGLVQRDRQLTAGIAMALALAQPMLQSGQNVGVRVGWGTFGNANAVAVSAAGVLARGFAGPTTSLVVDGGIGFASAGQTSGRVGLTFGW